MHTSKVTAWVQRKFKQGQFVQLRQSQKEKEKQQKQQMLDQPAQSPRFDASPLPPSPSLCVLYMCVVCVCLCIRYVCVVYVMCVCMCIVCIVCVMCMCTSGVYPCLYEIRAGDQHMNSTVPNSILLGSIICPMHTSTLVPSANPGSGKFYTSVKVSKL